MHGLIVSLLTPTDSGFQPGLVIYGKAHILLVSTGVHHATDHPKVVHQSLDNCSLAAGFFLPFQVDESTINCFGVIPKPHMASHCGSFIPTKAQHFVMMFTHSVLGVAFAKEQVIRVEKNSWGCRPPHSNYLGVFLRLRRTFPEVITFSEASTHEF